MGLEHEARETIRQTRSDLRVRARPYIPQRAGERRIPLRGDRLTPIELDVLLAAADGLSQADTAERLAKSVETVKTQRRQILFKLGAANTTHAVALALRRGVIQ